MTVHQNEWLAIDFEEKPIPRIKLIHKTRQSGEVVKEWRHSRYDYDQLEKNIREAKVEMEKITKWQIQLDLESSQ